MGFPKIDVCALNCSEIKVTDITGVYDVSTNPDGWGGDVSASNISTAKIIIKDNKGETVKTVDVLPTIQNNDPVTGNITFPNINWDLSDGIYKFTLEYKETDDTVHSITETVYVFSKAECCLEKAWIKFVDNASNCSKSFLEELLTIDALIYGAKTSAACLKPVDVQTISDKIDRFCKYNKCNC